MKFGIENGLPSLKSIRIAKIDNQLIFTTEKGLFQGMNYKKNNINSSIVKFL